MVAVVVTASTACYDETNRGDVFGDDGFGGLDETTGAESSDPTIGDEGDPGPTSGDGDPATSGDGDGDPDPTTTGDGDGDPDPTTTGDGDGDPNPTTTGDGDGDPDPSTTGGDPSDVPDNAYCNPVSDWDPAWVDWELEVLELVNQARAQGGNCHSQGTFPPSGPLSIHPALTCAARVHSMDMADNDFFDHTNLQGKGPGWRLGQAGYMSNTWGENIAAGYGSPQEVVTGWLASDGHCSNMLEPGFDEIGIGYAYSNGSSYKHYWTQDFGG